MLQKRVVNGPSKFEAAVRLVDGTNAEQGVVSFLVCSEEGLEPHEELVKINRIERADVDGETYSIRGFALANHVFVDIAFNFHSRVGRITYLR